MTLRSPERHWRTAALVLLALLAGWYFAVRHGSGAGVTPGSVLAAALLVAAWRVHHGRLVCVRAIQRTGKPVDLLATRGYSLIHRGQATTKYTG